MPQIRINGRHERVFDQNRFRKPPANERRIAFFHRLLRHHHAAHDARGVGAERKNQDARRAAVKTMNRPNMPSRLISHALNGKNPVAVCNLGSVHEHLRGLVDDNKMRVFIEYVERRKSDLCDLVHICLYLLQTIMPGIPPKSSAFDSAAGDEFYSRPPEHVRDADFPSQSESRTPCFCRNCGRYDMETFHKKSTASEQNPETSAYFQASPITSGTHSAELTPKPAVTKHC